MTTKNTVAAARDQILSGLKAFIEEAQHLLDQAEDRASKNVTSARDRVTSGVRSAQDSMAGAQEQVRMTAREATTTTHRYVRSNPWTAIGVGAVTGIVVGMILGRR